jgi:hypothetical protein
MPARGREETANEASRLLTQDEATSETSRVSGARNLSSWSAGCDQRACGENERSPRLIDVTSRDAPAVRWCARTWCADARVPTFESLQRVLSWLSAFRLPSRSARWRAAPRSSILQSNCIELQSRSASRTRQEVASSAWRALLRPHIAKVRRAADPVRASDRVPPRPGA